MAIRLEKGQRINLEKESGTKLTYLYLFKIIISLLPYQKKYLVFQD